MAGGRYAEALLRVMERTREVERAAREQADLARRMGDSDYEARQVHTQALYEGVRKIKDGLED